MLKNIKRNILLNPGPATTTDSVKYSMVVPDICPREKEFGDLMLNVSEQLIKVVHGDEQFTAILFAGSGTAAVEACISSIVPENKKILIIDNGSYGARMAHIAHTHHLKTIVHTLPPTQCPQITEIENILSENQGDISHIAMVHHETSTGILNPIADIAHLAHRYDAEIIVDAISSFAGLPIDIKAMDIDYLISSSNKCLQGMAGIAFVICKKQSLNSNLPSRSVYLNLYNQYIFFKKTHQLPFTPPVQIFYALKQALKEFFQETANRRYERYKRNYTTLYTRLKDWGFKFLVADEDQSGLLLSIIEPQHLRYRFDEMHDYLYERGFTIYPGKHPEISSFRLSVIGQIDQKDIIAFLNTFEQYLHSIQLLENLYSREKVIS